jgi:RNase adaptor protein for sRNA GlmZ degradation
MRKKNLTHAELQALLNNVPISFLKNRKAPRKKSSVVVDKRKFTKEEDYIHFECIQLLKNEFPSVRWVSNILDGARLGMLVRKHTKGMRNEPGTSDILILEPIKNEHGMVLEVKTITGVLSKEQKQFLQDMWAKGYRAKVGYGLEECFQLIREYLG